MRKKELYEKKKFLKYAHVVASKNKIKIIQILFTKPQTTTEISKKMNSNISLVSKLLKELVSEELVICLNPRDKKGKLFYFSEDGEWVYDVLKN